MAERDKGGREKVKDKNGRGLMKIMLRDLKRIKRKRERERVERKGKTNKTQFERKRKRKNKNNKINIDRAEERGRNKGNYFFYKWKTKITYRTPRAEWETDLIRRQRERE